jgi:hypothetical protein
LSWKNPVKAVVFLLGKKKETEAPVLEGSELNNVVLDKLLDSIQDLEQSITSAQRALLTDGNYHQDFFDRLRQYESMLLTQRQLADKLNVSMRKGEWEEVARSVRMINGISTMLRDDAKQVANLLATDTAQQKKRHRLEVTFDS